jgi:probable rRNA maturation factor
MPKVHFSYADKQLVFPNKTALKQYVETIFKKEKKELGSVRYVFCSDEFLLAINKSSLNHDYYTDIITFDLSNLGQPIESEIYVSIDRVKDNAQQLGVSFKEELCRVVFHGALHLCGYKDKKKEDVLLMRKKEGYYLSVFFRQ